MGKILLASRLVIRDIAHHRAQAVMLMLVVVAATSTLTLGLLVHGGTTPTYRTTRQETAGPDVVATSASSGPGHLTTPADLRSLDSLIDAPGVVGHTGPYPVAWATLRTRGVVTGAMAEGRDTAPASIDQPKVIQGSWVRSDGVVVEQSFAEALDVGPGDRVTLNGRSFRVVGIAVTAAIPPYPNATWATPWSPYLSPGLVWLTRAGAESLATGARPLFYLLNLKLANPASDWSFAAPQSSTAPMLMPWQEIEQEDAQLLLVEQRDLLVASWLLTLLAIASLAVLVAGRMAEQTRRVGLIKAAGGSPGLVVLTVLFEYLLLALVSAGGGLAIGWLLAPLLNQPGAGLVGAVGAPALKASTVEIVLGVALGVTLVATLLPARRAARTSTVNALADTARPPRRRGSVIWLSSHLPPPLLVGTRLASRRPRRIVLSAATVVITVSGIVAVLIAHVNDAPHGRISSALPDPRTIRLDELMLIITIMASLLAAMNVLFVTWTAVQDSRRPLAVTRALGATPNQVSAGLSAAQVLPALIGAILGIPGGIGLYASVSQGPEVMPPLWWLISLVLGTIVLIAALTSIPARLGVRVSVGAVLQAETT